MSYRTPFVVALGLLLPAIPAAAQTDYYNTDAGRPLMIEDAHPLERYGFELQFAPVRIERSTGGQYRYGFEPELAWGFLPGAHLEIGAPIVSADRGAAGHLTALAGLEIGTLVSLNTETRTLPALAIAADVLLPVGGLAPDETYATAKGILTRTFTLARVHLNGAYTFGDEPAHGGAGHELSRWMAGGSIDRVLPLQSLLIGAEVVARQPMDELEELGWSTGAGLRWQYGPRLALDAGVHRVLTGDDRAWSVTFGAAYAFAIRGLMPRGR